MFTLDHLGIAVRSLEQARKFYEQLGMHILPPETIEAESVRVAGVVVGDSRLQLIEASGEDSPIQRFLQRRGEGLHHVALRVTDLPRTIEKLKAAGTRFVTDEIRIGAGNRSYIFVHPSSTGGVLLELCEEMPLGVG